MEISFRFKEKYSPASYSSDVAGLMQHPYPREWILSKSLIREYNPQLINETLNLLRHDNFILKVSSQTFTDLNQREKWYETEHKIEPLSDKLNQVICYLFYFIMIIVFFNKKKILLFVLYRL